MKEDFNIRYMRRRAKELGCVSFIFPIECAAAILAVSMWSGKWYAGKWCAGELANAFVAYGTQGMKAEIDITDPFSNWLFWELHKIIADSQSNNFFNIDNIDRNQMMLVKEYADAYRRHIEMRQVGLNHEQCLPFIFHGYYRKELECLCDEDKSQALLSIINFGVQGIWPYESRNPELNAVVFKICSNIRHEQEELMDYLQREKDRESLFMEYAACPSAELDKELEQFEAFLKRIYDPKYKSVFGAFYCYNSYVHAAYSLRKQASTHELLYAIMRYGTEGDKVAYEITDPEAALLFIQIKASIKASQGRYLKTKIDGKKGGRPEQFPKKLFVMMATRGFCTTEEMADFLGCSLKTVERKINNDEIDRLQLERFERLKARRTHDPKSRAKVISYYGWNNDDQYEGRTCAITRDPRMIPLLRNTGIERFKDLDENNIPPNPRF